MSSVSEQDHINPRDPLYYAPRWLRERSALRGAGLGQEADGDGEADSDGGGLTFDPPSCSTTVRASVVRRSSGMGWNVPSVATIANATVSVAT